jgi:ATP-dependent DNA helicase RecQ
MNKAKLNMFARSKSASHKNVTEMYLSELKAFKKQLEAIAYNENNHLKITSAGSDVLFGRATARLVVIRREETNETKRGRKRKATVPAQELPLGLPNTENEALFEALRKLRKRLADEEALPAYIVLSDKVLHLLSTSRPTNLEEFGNISGIGEHKKKKYGKEFINLIRKYSE